MTQLVKIKPAPPLRQSLISVMACPVSYRAIVIDGLKPPPSGPSDRGEEVHYVAAEYTEHCVHFKVPADWKAFERIAKVVGADAYTILEGVRDNYVVDFEHVVGTEIEFFLDDNFQPCEPAKAAFAGRIDIGLLMGNQGGLDDWKSHLKPFAQSDVPDDQSDMYSLAWFQLNPQIETLLFRYRFVRYANCERTAEYTRSDLPRFMSKMEHHRQKQLAIHANPEKAEAIPSKQCLYCPLLNNGCPIPAQVNPYATPTMQERLKLAVYMTYASEENNARLREYVDAAGMPLQYTDGKGDSYLFGPKATESTVYPVFLMNGTEIARDDQYKPVMPIIEALVDYAEMEPKDAAWMAKLRIGSTELKGKLQAKKRVHLDQRIQDLVQPVTKIKTGLHRAGETEEE